MSAITYPTAGNRHPVPTGPSTAGFRRMLTALRPSRWDDLPHIERTTSPSEIALRAAAGIPRMHR